MPSIASENLDHQDNTIYLPRNYEFCFIGVETTGIVQKQSRERGGGGKVWYNHAWIIRVCYHSSVVLLDAEGFQWFVEDPSYELGSGSETDGCF